MAATIKPIEAKSIHQIQSGQVIVDLCSVVKELVENALDAQATAIEVRFKNYGLDGIEVQDNGTGIAESNYESIALKHYTSKLSSYDDLSKLRTFGFRGEALSSLCAVSTFAIQTAQAQEAPKGNRLEFEVSGKLKSTSIVATQRGTTAIVENLFARLPVRQKELSKNIKREYGKVMGILHAYACVSTMVKFSVKNTSKGKTNIAFSTKSNATMRDNIANVYGAKMLSQLLELDMPLNFPSASMQPDNDEQLSVVTVTGHISKPVFGEGRQTPDRQMFFVNGRPCGLPQIAKAINEVYKSYNVSQSPFICADLKLDTNAYDVNVSPDKRTIFLHDSNALTEGLKAALTDRFDKADQTVPQSQRLAPKLPSFRPLTVNRSASRDSEELDTENTTPIRLPDQELDLANNFHEDQDRIDDDGEGMSAPSLLKSYFGGITSPREDVLTESGLPRRNEAAAKRAEKIAQAIQKRLQGQTGLDEYDDVHDMSDHKEPREPSEEREAPTQHIRDFNARIHEQEKQREEIEPLASRRELLNANQEVSSVKRSAEQRGVVPDAFDRMRSRRLSPELATITIGDKVITRMIGTPKSDNFSRSKTSSTPREPASVFSRSLQQFGTDHADEDSITSGDHHDVQASSHERVDKDSSPSPKTDDADDSEAETRQSQLEPGRVEVSDGHREDESADVSGIYDEAREKAQEENRVRELIRIAEESKARSSPGQKRETRILKGGSPKDSTVNILANMDIQIDQIKERFMTSQRQTADQTYEDDQANDLRAVNTTEEHLSLTISKDDFANMHIAGQFNLGFMIAVRYKKPLEKTKRKDELFIIDQHASDEKYNFERLQAETVIGNQRLVHPVILDLTAVEEEIVLENTMALQQNGFIVETDLSGKSSVGERCQLMSLPLSKETTLGIPDLEELIHLLSETHMGANSTSIPRPTRIRRMFAMRACRSSIMIGKTLSQKQMRNILEHMGTIDKPWNCPHGRPTMRHLISLDDLDGQLWNEGDGVVSDDTTEGTPHEAGVWAQYLAQQA